MNIYQGGDPLKFPKIVMINRIFLYLGLALLFIWIFWVKDYIKDDWNCIFSLPLDKISVLIIAIPVLALSNIFRGVVSGNSKFDRSSVFVSLLVAIYIFAFQ